MDCAHRRDFDALVTGRVLIASQVRGPSTNETILLGKSSAQDQRG
jgi:hypothetical protein